MPVEKTASPCSLGLTPLVVGLTVVALLLPVLIMNTLIVG